jgi:hypothetical protein
LPGKQVQIELLDATASATFRVPSAGAQRVTAANVTGAIAGAAHSARQVI